MKTRHLWTYDVRPGHLFRIPEVPADVMLDVTWACDQRCSFCYNPREDRRRGHPDLSTLLEIQRRLAAWGVGEVLYLGGEPMLHPGIMRLLATGADQGLRQRLITNGARLGRDRARELMSLGVEVGVSLHGATPEVHDSLVGRPGSFARALAALDDLVAAGASTWVQFSPTVANPGSLTALAGLLRSRHGGAVKFLDVNRLLSLGEACRAGRSILLDEDGWWAALREVAVLSSAGWYVRVESVPRCWARHRGTAAGFPEQVIVALLATFRTCMMGITQLAFDPAGRLKICPAGAPAGPSILDNDPALLWRESPVLIARRRLEFLPSECVDFEANTLCEEFYDCVDGCRGGYAIGLPDNLAGSFNLLETTCGSSSPGE